MDTPLRLVQKKAYSLLDSTSFPDILPNLTDNHLQCLNITPIAFDRTSNPHRIHTFHDVSSPSKVEAPMKSAGDDTSKHTIDTFTLTSSDIDSLADRVRSLLGKTAKYDPFETITPPAKGETTNNNSVNSGSFRIVDESSLELLPNVINSVKINTNFTLPSLATTSHNIASFSEISLPVDVNNDKDSFSSSVSSDNLISFSPNSFRELSDTNQKECHEEEAYKRSPLVLPKRLSTIIEASKSSDSVAVSPARNASSLLLEADQILERIHKLQLMGTNSQSHNLSDHRSYEPPKVVTFPPPSIESVHIPDQSADKHTNASKSSFVKIAPELVHNEINLDHSDPETEYLEPPVELHGSMHNQTFNSHIYTRKVNATTEKRAPNQIEKRPTERITATVCQPPPDSSPSSESHLSFRPNRTILEEEGNCLNQMQKDTNDLRRLHLQLMQFEKDYAKQTEKRRAKKKAMMAMASKKATACSTAAESTSETTDANSDHNPNAKSGKDLKLLRKQKLKATASGRQVEANLCTVQANVDRKSSSSSLHCPSSSSGSTSQATTKWSTCREITTQRHRKEEKHQSENQQHYHEQPQHRHSNSNPRQVRFDHQHIAQRVEQFRVDCQLNEGRPNKRTIQTAKNSCEQLCACCLRHSKMNRLDGNLQRNLDCLQLDSARLDDVGHNRRPQTVTNRVNQCDREENTQFNANKSVQTSFIMDTNEQRNKSAQTRPKTVTMGEFQLDYGYHQPGELSRTPPPTANSATPKKPLAYFVSLENGSGLRKKSNNLGTHRSNQRPHRMNLPETNGHNSGNTRVTNGPASIQPVAAYTLQDAFDRNCYQFKTRSEMRARRIKDNEELRRRTVDTRQKEIIQIFMKEKKIDSDRNQSAKRQQATGDHKNRHSGTHNSAKSSTTTDITNGHKISRPTATRASGGSNQENNFPRPLPLITRRVVADKEMRERTEKVYRKLPEVKAKCVSVRREEDARKRRLMLDIFKQRLKENAIQGRLNWPISKQAITA